MCGKMKSPLDRCRAAVRCGAPVHQWALHADNSCCWWLGATSSPATNLYWTLMAYQIVYQPSPRLGFDSFCVKVRRNGFMLYTLIVVISTLYVCFIMKPPKPKSQPKSKDTKKTVESNSDTSFENIQLEDVAHPVDRWSKRELYQYLGEHNIYPRVDEPLLHVRATAKKYYQGRETK